MPISRRFMPILRLYRRPRPATPSLTAVPSAPTPTPMRIQPIAQIRRRRSETIGSDAPGASGRVTGFASRRHGRKKRAPSGPEPAARSPPVTGQRGARLASSSLAAAVRPLNIVKSTRLTATKRPTYSVFRTIINIGHNFRRETLCCRE